MLSVSDERKLMHLVNLRLPLLAALFGAAIGLAASPRAWGAGKDLTILHLAARAANVADSGDAGPIEIRIVRWSTDEDVEHLRGELREGGSGKPLRVFQRSRPPAAVVFTPGVQGLGERARTRKALDCQFARQIETPAGRQLVIATDRPLGLGEMRPRNAPPPPLEFILLDIRFGPDGKGVGKTAPAANVVYNKEKKIFEIENYEAQPIRLRDVRSVNP